MPGATDRWVYPERTGRLEGGDADGDGDRRDTEDGDDEHHPPGSPALQGDRPPRRGERAELAEQVTRVSLQERTQLGRARHPAGGGERLSEFIGREVVERAAVHPRRVRAYGKNQHHVAEVDRLSPWRGTDLGEEDVDQQQLPAADHEVPRLDVAVRDAGIPELPDEQQPPVDDFVIDLGLADLDGTGEELGDEQ